MSGLAVTLIAYFTLYFAGHRTGKIGEYLLYRTQTSSYHSHAAWLHWAVSGAYRPLDDIELRLRQNAVRKKISGTWISSSPQVDQVEIFTDGRVLRIIRFESEPPLPPGEFPLEFGIYSYSMVAEINADLGLRAVLVPHGHGSITLEVAVPDDDDPFSNALLYQGALTEKATD